MPASLLPWLKPQFTDALGNPVASGKLYSFMAGLDTPQPTYSDVALTTANANPITLNAAGEWPTSIYLLPTGYKFRLDTAAGVTLWTVDDVEDVGAVAAAAFGTTLTQGGKAVTSGYTALATDHLITVASTGGPSPCLVNLRAASATTQPLAIKNTGTVALSVVPNGADLIDGVHAGFTVPVAVGPKQPTIWLASDGVSAYYILASHGL
jgi:hypothetical protein